MVGRERSTKSKHNIYIISTKSEHNIYIYPDIGARCECGEVEPGWFATPPLKLRLLLLHVDVNLTKKVFNSGGCLASCC